MKLASKGPANKLKAKQNQALIGVVSRLSATWRLFWQHRRKLLALTAIVVVPSMMLRAYQELTIDFSLVLFFASLYCVLALIYFCQHIAEAQSLSVAKIYTSGSGRLLQLLGVALTQSLAIIPAVFGAALLMFVGSFGLSAWLYIPGALLLIMGALLITALSLTQFIVACENVSVWQSLRLSWQRTQGRRIGIALQFLAIFAVITIASSLLFFVINLSSVLATSWFVQGVVGAILGTVFLPWFITYGYSIYDETAQ